MQKLKREYPQYLRAFQEVKFENPRRYWTFAGWKMGQHFDVDYTQELIRKLYSEAH